ncbi:MAG TPA: hypothetical protein DET40_25925 [Lentisphaeria bacterium]|nr:hypothetical protein [Lentisphaeria bacterium]
MKKIFSVIMAAALLAVIAGCNCPFFCGGAKAEAKVPEGVKAITTAELQKIVADKSALIFDARTGKYDTGERVPGAKTLSAANTADEIAKAIPDKNAAVVTYCANTACPASGDLAGTLKKMGYTNIMEYPEGIEGWIKAGNKVDKVK